MINKKNNPPTPEQRHQKFRNLFRKVNSWVAIATFFVIFGYTKTSNAQSYPKTYQTWNDVGEDYDNSIDVAYSVTQCDSAGKDSIFLMVFNEKPTADTSSFDLTIFSADKKDSTVISFTVELAISEMARHECGSGLRKDLAIRVPEGYDPEKLTVAVKFD